MSQAKNKSVMGKRKPSKNGKPSTRARKKKVVIKTFAGRVASIPIDAALKAEAEYWSKRLDSRGMLDDNDHEKMELEAASRLAKLSKDLDVEQLKIMSENAVVQVTIPFDETDLAPRDFDPVDEPDDSSIEWALMMPWEYVLSAATKKYRQKTSLCVIRHVDGNDEAMESRLTAANFCFVESAPGQFAGSYDFSTERRLIHDAFEHQQAVEIPVSPSIEDLGCRLEENSPGVIHVSAIDTRLGERLAREAAAKTALLEQDVDPTASLKPGTGVRRDESSKSKTVDVGGASAVSSGLPKKSALGTANKPFVVATKSDEDIVEDRTIDGLMFNDGSEAVAKDFRTIAQTMNRGERKPQLIGFNCQFSGARIAPYCVALGAREAIGIQNTLSDELAERFFIRFYHHWLHLKWKQDSLAAFVAAWQFVKPMGKELKGTGIILWVNSDIFRRSKTSKKLIQPNKQGIQEVHEELVKEKAAHGRLEVIADPSEHAIKDLVRVKVKTSDVITPCMLHYGESILKSLELSFIKPRHSESQEHEDCDDDTVLKEDSANPCEYVDDDCHAEHSHSDEKSVECIREIEIEVTLKVGPDTYPYRTQVAVGVGHPKIELANGQLKATDENPAGGIKVPLTSELLRSASDNVRANLYVNVEWKGQVLYRHTHSVHIAPVNEWRLNKKDSLLQPMFVQPRDNLVKEVVAAGQKYLYCLEGSPKDGFRGYQAENIEPQLDAIWSALLYDFRLDYVSPPPSYNEGSQRLRTPSQVLHERRGTCVDLALLYASCLEWIELYPVIFNTSKHAFVGCWRYADTPDPAQPHCNSETGEEILSHEVFFEKFKKGEFSKKESIIDGYPWVIDDFKVVSDLVYQGAIIPLEAVCLTEYKLYDVAKDYAISYFLKETDTALEKADKLYPASLDGFYPGEFESVTDTFSSRQRLQPLPLGQV